VPAQAFRGKPCVCRARLDVCDQSCVADMMSTNFYIACLRLTGRRAVVVGGGPIALEKVEGLLAASAEVTVIAPELVPELSELVKDSAVVWHEREYAGPADLEGHLIAIAATDDTGVNVAVFDDAETRAMLVNVVDVPPLCNFILPAITRVGAISIAISTKGASPALAKRMKREIAAAFGPEYARLAELLNDVRGWAKATLPTYEQRRDFFEDIVNGEPDPTALLRAGDEDAVRELIERRQREHEGALAGA
jgi:siroheme synthase-like protein